MRTDKMMLRHPDNPIVRPGGLEWRRAAVYNPGVWQEEDGTVYMLERAAKSLRPHITVFGLLKSSDGVSFTHVVDKPVFTAQEIGFPVGSVEDPRLVKIDATYYLNFAIQPNSYVAFPNGWGIPTGFRLDIPGVCFAGERKENKTRSGLAVSKNLIDWKYLGETCAVGDDDRDQVLFPRKIGGYYYLLRRPGLWVGPQYGCDRPCMWITRSKDLKIWEPAHLFMQPEYEWESHKIGGSVPPVELDEGWLVLYHGVSCPEPDCPVYRVGAVLLDKSDPSKILGRTRHPILEPEHYYEKVGLIIPNTVFPCGNIIRDKKLWVYYGCCDTCISLATIEIDRLLSLLS
jgi:predicted GH43/DUF377 family glycosyl hydrolase